MNNKYDSKRALLVIDIQEDATGNTSKRPYKNSKEFIKNVNSAIEYSEKKGIIVIYIKHEVKSNFLNIIMKRNRFIKGTHGCDIDSRVKIVNNYIYTKDKGNALSNKELNAFLKQNGIEDVYMVGLDAAACVYKTSLGVIHNGYKAIALKDCIVTSNMSKLPKLLVKYRNKGILLTSIQKFKQIN